MYSNENSLKNDKVDQRLTFAPGDQSKLFFEVTYDIA